MTRVLSFAVLVVALAGCGGSIGATSCTSDADCNSGSQCLIDLGVCRPVVQSACATPCAADQECVSAQCLPRYSGLRITAPTSNSVIGREAVVEILLTTAPGRERGPAPEVTLRVQPPAGGAQELLATVAKDAGAYASQWSPTLNGEHVLVAQLGDGGLVGQPVTVSVDRRAPSFIFSVSPPTTRTLPSGVLPDPGAAAGSYLYSDRIAVEIRSSDLDLDIDSVRLEFRGHALDGGLRAGPVVTPARFLGGCSTHYCARAHFELSQSSLDGVRGTMAVSVSGRDTSDNNMTAVTSLPVTRLERTIGGAPFLTSTAISSAGVLVAVQGSAQTYGVRFSTADGTGTLMYFGASPQLLGPIVIPLSDGGEIPMSIGADGFEVGVSAGPTQPGVPTSCTAPFGTLRSGLVATQFAVEGGLVWGAVAVGEDGGVRHLLAFSPEAPGSSQCATRLIPPALLGTSMSSLEDQLLLGSSAGTRALSRYSVTNDQISESLSERVPLTMATRAIAFLGGETIVAGGDSDEPLIAVARDGGTPWRFQIPIVGGVVVEAGPPAIDGEGNLYFGGSDQTFRKARRGSAAGLSVPSDGIIRGAPLLGRDGLIYTVGHTGTLQVWNRQLQLQWQAPGLLGPTDNSPNIDCFRERDGGVRSGLGRLFLASDAGFFTVLVNSPGIDVDAGWPRLGHDPYNSGNGSVDLQRFRCP